MLKTNNMITIFVILVINQQCKQKQKCYQQSKKKLQLSNNQRAIIIARKGVGVIVSKKRKQNKPIKRTTKQRVTSNQILKNYNYQINKER